ncbi:MAG TPA: lysophospholipid acyltransferase family protein, partial [Rhodospirillales bacterium]|nr:lysophospholipid acyltransferase family protein [Rhodospirillales bacterium]
MVLVNVVLMGAYALSLGPARPWRRPLQATWCRTLCRTAGLRLRITGVPRNDGPTLFVANHCSYLDIPVIAREVDATFVAKAEVARWPLFGQAARLTRTVFIHRLGAEAKAQGVQLHERLARGENLMLFAEGTSTDGAGVAPFKSSLFGIAERPPPGVDLRIQPVSITYARALDNTPLTGERRGLYCWFGDATMFPHLWRMLSLRGAEVELHFLEPIAPGGVGRKELARIAHAAVAASVAGVNARLDPEPSRQSFLRTPGEG